MRNPSNMFEFIGVGEIAETTIQMLSLNLNTTWSSSMSEKRGQSGMEEVEQLVFQQARDYLNKVREGFVLSVRSSEIPDTYQLRYLLDRVLFDWDAVSDELGLDLGEDSAPQNATEIASEDCVLAVGRSTEPTNIPDELLTGSHAAEEDSLSADGPAVSDSDVAHQNEQTDANLEPVRQQLQAFGMAAIALGALPKLPAEQVTFPHSYGKPPTYADISAPSSPAEMLIRIEELEEMIWQLMSGDPGELVQAKYGPVRRTYGFFETSAWLVRNDAQRFGIKKSQSAGLTFF